MGLVAVAGGVGGIEDGHALLEEGGCIAGAFDLTDSSLR